MLFKGQMNMPGHGVQGQKKIESIRVLVVGAGGIGNPLSQLLVRSGFKNITIVDFDTIEETNLPRQFMFRESDVGRLKAAVVAKHLDSSFAGNSVIGLGEDARNVALADYDFVLEGTDSLKTKFEISRKCQSSRIPFIMGSIYRNTSQIYVFPNTSSTINMSDLFGSADIEVAEQSCSAVGVYAHQCMFTASIMVSECIKTILFGREQAMLIHCNLNANTMTAAPILPRQYGQSDDTNRVTNIATPLYPEPECVDLATVDESLVYDVRDEAEFEAKPGKYRNLSSRSIIHAKGYDEFQGAVFVCASGKRAKLVARHVNEMTGSNTARYGVQF